MRSKITALGFALVLSALVASGCRPTMGPSTEPPSAAPTEAAPGEAAPAVAPGEAATAVAPTPPEPTSEPQPTSTPVPATPDEAINISYDDAIADDVVLEIVPAEELMGGVGVMPEHVGLSFSGYVLPGTFHEPRIHVYSVSDLEAGSEAAADIVAALGQLLAEKPAAADGIPFLPMFNALQAIRAQVAYVDFGSGAGVRFLTHYTQGLVPVNNNELFYTFQGLSSDGTYYVSAILPVSHPTLPADGSVLIPDGEFETHMRDAEQQLNAQDASSFTPDLLLLDAMIRSLAVVSTAGLPAAPTPPPGEPGSQGDVTPTATPPPGASEDPYAGWASYANADYGFAFRYPPSWAIEEEPHMVKLSQGALALVIGYRRDTEEELGSLGDFPAGSFEYRGVVRVLEQEFPKSVLVYEGKDKVVLTGGEVDELVFTIRLDDLGADYETSAIPDAAQIELDQILASFERVTPR